MRKQNHGVAHSVRQSGEAGMRIGTQGISDEALPTSAGCLSARSLRKTRTPVLIGLTAQQNILSLKRI